MLNPRQGNRDFLQRPAVYVIMNNSYTCWFSSIGFPTHSGSLSSPFSPASHPGGLTTRAASTPLAGSSAGSEVGRRERPQCFCPAPSSLCIFGSRPTSLSSLSFHWILVSPLLPLPFQTRLGMPSHRCQSLGATTPLVCSLSPAHTSGSTP